jgi:hypothetical protein
MCDSPNKGINPNLPGPLSRLTKQSTNFGENGVVAAHEPHEPEMTRWSTDASRQSDLLKVHQNKITKR